MKQAVSQWMVMAGLVVVIGILKWWDSQWRVAPTAEPVIEEAGEQIVGEGMIKEVEIVPSPTFSTPTNRPLPSLSPTDGPTEAPSIQTEGGLLNWRYPGSQILAESTNRLFLKTSDSAEAVTEWYVERAGASEWQTRTKVTTRANERVENRLVFAREGEEVAISISQEDAGLMVEIEVELR